MGWCLNAVALYTLHGCKRACGMCGANCHRPLGLHCHLAGLCQPDMAVGGHHLWRLRFFPRGGGVLAMQSSMEHQILPLLVQQGCNAQCDELNAACRVGPATSKELLVFFRDFIACGLRLLYVMQLLPMLVLTQSGLARQAFHVCPRHLGRCGPLDLRMRVPAAH
jgi:hypothetical protein